MKRHRIEIAVEKCHGCRFLDIAGSLDRVCNFEPNFEVAPRKRHFKLSDFEDDVKRKDDRTVCILVDWFYDQDKKPGWCRLKKTSLIYE